MTRFIEFPETAPDEYVCNLRNRIVTEQMAFDMLATLGKYEAIASKSSHDKSVSNLERNLFEYAAQQLRKLRIHSEQTVRKHLRFKIELVRTTKGRYCKLCHLDGHCHYAPLSSKEYIVLSKNMGHGEPAHLVENAVSEPIEEVGITFIESMLDLLTSNAMFAIIGNDGTCFMRNVPEEFMPSVPVAKKAALENALYRGNIRK